MHHDDETVGRILTRRELLHLIGQGGTAAVIFGHAGHSLLADVTQAAAPGCIVKPQQTEGPYFLDRQLVRSDIRVEPSTGAAKAGIPLMLALTVYDVSNGQCRPLEGAVVDVWQCDAKGVYSGVIDRSFNTVGQKFLRGVQTSSAAGFARFTTIHPGWYSGRAVHIHFKIRAQVAASAWEFTSQWYFDEAFNDRIFEDPRYSRPGRRDTLNANDGIYRNGGVQLLLKPGRAEGAEGYEAQFAIGLDLSDAATGRPDGGAGRGRGGRGGRGQ